MNDQDKLIAEEIIRFIKENNNNVSKAKLYHSFEHVEYNVKTLILRKLLEEYKFIKLTGSFFSTTNTGWEFNSFKQYEKKLKNTPLTLYQRIHVALTAIAVLTALFSLIYSNYNNKNQINNSDFENFRDSVNHANKIINERIYFLENRDSISFIPE